MLIALYNRCKIGIADRIPTIWGSEAGRVGFYGLISYFASAPFPFST